MLTLKVGQVQTYDDIDAKETRLDVPYQILDEQGAVLEERRQSFPLGTTEDEIGAFLKQALAVYQDDLARHEAGKERQAALDTSSEVAAKLSGVTITP